MITSPTVLVLGAGASKPYGYPLGQELVNKIIVDALNPNSLLCRTVGLLSFPDVFFKNLGNDLKTSARPSIDAFLESRTDHIPLGQLAIAFELLGYEKKETIHATNDWYQYLFNKMCDPNQFESFGASHLSIVTFNYDRSLEFCLFTALKASFQKNHRECLQNFEKIPIIHVHGRIGPSPVEESAWPPYGSNPIRSADLPSLASQIQIIHQADENTPQFKAARDLLSQAERICFLGFGFHEINLKRLFKGVTTLNDPTQTPNTKTWNLFSGVKIFGHNFDFTESEKRDIQRRLPGSTCDWGARGQSCEEFLRESGALLG